MQSLVCALLIIGASANQQFLSTDPTVVAKPVAAQKQVAQQMPRARYQPTVMDQVKYYGNPMNWQGLFQMAVFKVRMFLNTYVTQIMLYGGVALGIYLTVGRLAIWKIKEHMTR